MAFTFAHRERRHDRTVAFLGNHHRVAAVQRQVVLRRRVMFEVVRNRVAGGFLGGVHQQLEVARQRQLLFLDDLHGIHGHYDAVFIILSATAIHAIADQRDLERVEFGAVLEHPVFRRDRYHISMGVNADHFIAAAFQGDFVHAVIDVTEIQVEGLGQALNLVGDLEEFRVLVLRQAVDIKGRDFHQLAQGFEGGFAVLHARINTQQAVDFILLVGGQGFIGQEGIDGWSDVIGFRQVALGQGAEETTKIADRCFVEVLDDRRALFGADVGGSRCGDGRKAGGEQRGGNQFFKGKVHCWRHSFAGGK